MDIGLIPQDQLDRVLNSEVCDIDGDFLGFTDIYLALAQVIPKHFTVVDLGCAYAPQAWLFKDHKQYIGVDLPWVSDWHPDAKLERFCAPNTVIRETTIREFIETEAHLLDLEETFAICSYVPPWHDDNRKLARETFENLFVYYPCNKSDRIVLAKRFSTTPQPR